MINAYFLLVLQRDYNVHVVCVSVCLSVALSVILIFSEFKVKGQGHRSPKGQKRVFDHISETNSRGESGQNVGEINIDNFCIWHFGLWPIVSKFARGQGSDMGYAACETLQSLGLLLFY